MGPSGENNDLASHSMRPRKNCLMAERMRIAEGDRLS